jgi:hypothetical protein
MGVLAQGILVALAVLACALYSAWRLMSARLKLRALGWLAALPAARSARWHAALTRRTLAKLDGCAGCAGALRPGAAAPNRTAGAPRR